NDKCPGEPEDIDNFQDQDGCPDLDNDNDGIADIRDKCPNRAEDLDGFEDEDGCPEFDNDKDAVPDSIDNCKNIPEDFDGFEDDDGCPDFDNDSDGIPDSLDKCPNDKEDKDGFQDNDGCEDIDNDTDGIPDSVDKCPNQPENRNNFQDDDGCPDKKTPEIQKKMVFHNIQFKTGSAELTYDSYAVLDPIIAQLKAYPEVRIEIRGHTDSRGKNKRNEILSTERAASVKTYMVTKGIDPTRIEAKGFGESLPIATNKTAKGRGENRRIEIYRLN
ncbi:MAG: OmpA family protein, partial [bacterium]